MAKKIKVLIVDDSQVKQKILEHIFSLDDGIEIVGYAKNAEETLDFIEKLKPDVITMDVNISGDINGFELTRKIMKENPIPVILISAIRSEKNRQEVSKALTKSGGLFFIDSPPGPWSENFDKASRNIIRQVKLLSKNKGILVQKVLSLSNRNQASKTYELKTKLILIAGASGGPVVLKKLISKLPAGFKTPIIISQQISDGMDELLVNQLRADSSLSIKIPENNEKLEEGNIYLSPASKFTELENSKVIISEPSPTYDGPLPSASILFSSILNYSCKNILGIIISGEGEDGSEELKAMKENGCITIAQDDESSEVYGMPQAAAKLCAATYIMNQDMIADYLIKFDKK